MSIYHCIVCNREFHTQYALSGHKRVHGPSKGVITISEKSKARYAQMRLETQARDTKKCLYCGDTFIGSRTFCNHSCAASFNNRRRAPRSEESKKKVSESLRRLRPRKVTAEVWGEFSILLLCKCRHCRSQFFDRSIRRQYCPNCSQVYGSNGRNKYCFKFNVFDYPDLFDLELIRSRGWHAFGGRKAKNTKGLTRDHRVSVNCAIKNKLDPYYISHPVNCEIMSFDDNNRKKTRSSITYDELVSQVDAYDSK